MKDEIVQRNAQLYCSFKRSCELKRKVITRTRVQKGNVSISQSPSVDCSILGFLGLSYVLAGMLQAFLVWNCPVIDLSTVKPLPVNGECDTL